MDNRVSPVLIVLNSEEITNVRRNAMKSGYHSLECWRRSHVQSRGSVPRGLADERITKSKRIRTTWLVDERNTWFGICA